MNGKVECRSPMAWVLADIRNSSMPGTGICKNRKIRGISTKIIKIKFIKGGKV